MLTCLLGICLPSSPGTFCSTAHIRKSSNAQAYLSHPDEAACTVHPRRSLLGNSQLCGQHRGLPGTLTRYIPASNRQTPQPGPKSPTRDRHRSLALRVPPETDRHCSLALRVPPETDRHCSLALRVLPQTDRHCSLWP